MRPSYPSLTPARVHSTFRTLLHRHLPATDYKRSVTANQLLDLIVLIATTGRTLTAVVRARFDFCHEIGRRALHAFLPPQHQLTEHMADLLHAIADFSRRDRRRPWILAIDTHNVGYYGGRNTLGILGGQKKQGTSYFFVYATAIRIHKRRRYTRGMLPQTQSMAPHLLVQTLLDQIRTRGILIRGVVLDSGFDSADTLLLLQERGLSYTVPLRRKGTTTNRRNAAFLLPSGTITTRSWKSEKTHREVTTAVLVWRRSGEPRAKVFAFAGWGRQTAVSQHRRAWLARRRYRERFGIETSYRQKNQSRGWTTSRNAAYRFLLEGLAQALRQLWVRLTLAISRAWRRNPNDWIGELPFVTLLDWLREFLQQKYPARYTIDLQKPANTR